MDCVLLDAPCSGFGTLRRKPEIKWNRCEGDIAKLALLQAAMLDNAARHVRPGGALVYCVCTTEPEEGEAQADAFLERNPNFRGDSLREFLPEAIIAAITPECSAAAAASVPSLQPHPPRAHELRLFPNTHGVDGFYIARFVRNMEKPKWI
jgi:16S rRNA (cytosine967-C5)-methyltransferase